MGAGRKIDFVVAGVQKGGTSALFDYLNEMPSLQLPLVKEAHFFDDEAVDWDNPDYRQYHDLFVDDGRLCGEATPIYIYWPDSLKRIRAYNPAMKIIMLFRDPIKRAWSHWQMEFAKRKEIEAFAWCIREGRERVKAGDRTVPGHHRVFSYVERGFYGDQIERLFQLFPVEQCLLLKSEDLLAKPDPVLRLICKFLEIAPPEATVAGRIVGAARDIKYPALLECDDVTLLADLYRPQLARLEALTGMSAESWIRGWGPAGGSQ